MADENKTTYITLANLTSYNAKVKETYSTKAETVDLTTDQMIGGVKTFSNAIVGDLTGTAARATADGYGKDISTTYATKEEVSKIITAEIVVLANKSDLPAQPTAKQKKTIYLVANGSSETQNVYDEYVWATTGESSGAWEKIGTTQVDLSNYVTINTAQTITGIKTFAETIVGSVNGNAGTADKLKTAVTINGTSFDGSANITTDVWGVAHNVTVADADETNLGVAVSVDGSADVTIKLPQAIKATLIGNADSATKADQDSDGNVISSTYVKATDIGGATDDEIDALFD